MEKATIYTLPKSSGRRYLIAHAEGKKLTFRQSALAKCCECCGGYVDGFVDCRVATCPLYPFMPYRLK